MTIATQENDVLDPFTQVEWTMPATLFNQTLFRQPHMERVFNEQALERRRLELEEMFRHAVNGLEAPPPLPPLELVEVFDDAPTITSLKPFVDSVIGGDIPDPDDERFTDTFVRPEGFSRSYYKEGRVQHLREAAGARIRKAWGWLRGH